MFGFFFPERERERERERGKTLGELIESMTRPVRVLLDHLLRLALLKKNSPKVFYYDHISVEKRNVDAILYGTQDPSILDQLDFIEPVRTEANMAICVLFSQGKGSTGLVNTRSHHIIYNTTHIYIYLTCF